ncbi:MAG: M43 family zinc metalloprotease [Bacteroidota bacterium]
MKKLLLIIIGLVITVPAAPAQRTCGTMDHHQHLVQNDPEAAHRMAKEDSRIAHWIREHGGENRSGAVITIPTVVHVVYRTTQQNISNAQIQSQIDVLNEDFRRLNADASSTPGVWSSVAADSEIEFCLARRDPNGNATDGILRVQTTVNSFSTNDNVKFSSSGGSDAWPRNDYLNIWVCNLGFGLLGYAQFPGQPAATDGVVIGYRYFGRTGVVQAPFNQGRTTTHEVGHWLNLRHIWGDDNGACSGSDQVGDTPNQAGPNYNCPSFPRTDNCQGTSPGVMYMNYMDYTDDGCMNMFTTGQKDRMTAVLNGSRSAIQNSQGCVPVSQVPDDAGVSAIVAPTGTSCTGSITPIVTLTNFGSNTLTSVTFNIQIDGGAITTFTWTGSLASFGSVNVTLPTQTIGPGNHTITVFTSNPNGNTDGDASNDSSTGTFTTTSAGGQSIPFIETFENGNFPPTGWTIVNPDNNFTWERSNTVGYNSSRSAWVNNYDYNAPGERDDLVTPVFDFSNTANPSVSWDLAYVLYSQSLFSDTLQVWVSTDCGSTWVKEWEKFDQALTTTTPFFQTTPFTPAGLGDWRRETLNLPAYAFQSSVQFRFRNVTDYENNLYIDNINVDGTVDLESELLRANVRLFPNPTAGRFNLEIATGSISDLEVVVFNPIGVAVHQHAEKNYTGQRLILDLVDQPAGVYFVQVKADGILATKKVSKY